MFIVKYANSLEVADMISALDKFSQNYVSIQAGNMENILKDSFEQLCQDFECDVALLILFNKEKNIATLENSFIKDNIKLLYSIPTIRYLCKETSNPLNTLIYKQTIVINKPDGDMDFNYSPLLKDMKSEAYIPLFCTYNSTVDLMGCIYLGSLFLDCFPVSKFEKSNIIRKSTIISKFLEAKFIKSNQISAALNSINVLYNAFTEKEPYLPYHSYTVANWCKEIGHRLSLPSITIQNLYIAGLLHDVGKINLNKSILQKSENLTDEEFELLKKHVEISCTIAKSFLYGINSFSDVPTFIKYHHERYDGKGYPYGLKDNDIPIGANILAIASNVDNMLSTRPYQDSMPINDVIKELLRNKGKKYYPELVDIMINLLTKAQKQMEDITRNPMTLCTLVVNLREDAKILEGSLIKKEPYFKFICGNNEKLRKIDISEIVGLELVVKDSNTVCHYYTKIEQIEDDFIYISQLKLKPSACSFNVLWDLNGILTDHKDNNPINISIFEIGGKSLSFSVQNEDLDEKTYNGTIGIKIFFDDCEIDITGKIIKKYKFGLTFYYEIEYSGISESKRDNIYRQLFKRQIQLRKAIVEYLS